MIRKINMEKNIQTVTFLIGNGFDIGALSALKSEYLTTYSQFYKYLETHCLNKDNLILVLSSTIEIPYPCSSRYFLHLEINS